MYTYIVRLNIIASELCKIVFSFSLLKKFKKKMVPTR